MEPNKKPDLQKNGLFSRSSASPSTPGGLAFNRAGGSRLASFKDRKQRDLTLGSAAKGRPAAAGGPSGSGSKVAAGPEKKKFVPNLNVQRKTKSAASAPADATKVKREPGVQQGSRGQQQQQQKGRSRPELIQTMGSVFSDGLSAEGIKRREGRGGGMGGGGRSEGAEPLAKPVLTDIKLDKEAEERRLKALFKDDFLADDLSSEGLYVPVQLPMVDTGKVFREVKKETEQVDGDANRKKKPNRILDSDDDSDVDDPAKMKVDSATEKKNAVIGKQTQSAVSTDLAFPDLVKSQKGDLLFIQLPDSLPGSMGVVKKEDPDAGAGKSSDADADAPNTSKTATTSSAGAENAAQLKCTLANLPEGYLGKIQVHKSGKTKLLLGGDLFDVDLGTQVGFLQDLVSVETSGDKSVGEMTVMGHVKHRMVLTPDWDHLFSKSDGPAGASVASDDDNDVDDQHEDDQMGQKDS